MIHIVVRKLTYCLIPLAVLASGASSSADALFPLDSGRAQPNNNCWAYATAHLLEARAQFRDEIAVVTHIEKSYRFWSIYDRLLNSAKRKEKTSNLLSVGGFSAEFFEIFQDHGFEIVSTQRAPNISDFEYPKTREYYIQPTPGGVALQNTSLVKETERKLIESNLTIAERKAFIEDRLPLAFRFEKPMQTRTAWMGETIRVADSFQKILGSDFAQMRKISPAVLISDGSYMGDVNDRSWVKYNSDRHWAFVIKDKKKIMEIMRLAMDRGWPTTLETSDHVMTALGYHTSKRGFAYAVSDTSGAYFDEGISWVTESALLREVTDITVPLHVIKDVIPPIPNRGYEALVRSVDIPFKN